MGKGGATIRTVELFCGIGGFRVAADRLGLRTVWANDHSAEATAVYEAMFGADQLSRDSLEDVVDEVPDHDVLTAGFPCQPFSSAGKKGGMADPRSDTVRSLLGVIELRKPAAVVLENVPFILSASGRRLFLKVVHSLAESGYGVAWRVVNAADVGLPQYRPRLLVVACLGSGPPDLSHEPEGGLVAGGARMSPGKADRLPSWGYFASGSVCGISLAPIWRDWSSLSLADWLDTDADPRYDFTDETLARISESKRVDRVIRGVEVLFNQDGGSRMGYTVYGISGLAPTLTATTSRHYERFAIRGRYRRLAPHEYARLQGFTDSHCETADHAKRYVLCGNAIPPPVAEWGLRRALGSAAESSSWVEAA